MIKIIAIVGAMLFSKLIRKIMFFVLFVVGALTFFNRFIYPKIMEDENMKYAIEYFKFWHKLPDEKVGTVRFLSDSLKQNHGDYKIAIGLKLMRYNNMKDDEAIKFIEDLKKTKNRSKFTDNILNIKLSNLYAKKDYKKSISYLNKISSDDPLFIYAKEEKMRILLTRTSEFKQVQKINKELQNYYKNVNLYPYYERIESFVESKSK